MWRCGRACTTPHSSPCVARCVEMSAPGAPGPSHLAAGERKCGVVRAPDAAMMRLAARQHGVVTTAQLAGLGLERGAVSHRVRQGRLLRLHRGVYLVAPAPLARTPES